MVMQAGRLETTLDLMRERVIRLERESAALRADLDEMAIELSWQADRMVSPQTLQKIAVGEFEIAGYRKLTGAQYPDAVLRLTLQAQKAATRLKRSVQADERPAAINAVMTALHQAAALLKLTIPDELEAAIGD